MNNRLTAFLLLCILFLSFLLGSRMILSGDFLYLYDQVREMIFVRDIVVFKKLMLIGTHSGVGGMFHGPLWLYILIPFFILGGGGPLFFSYAYIVLALLTVFCGFIVGTKLYNKEIGLFIAFLLAITPRIWGYVLITHGVNVIPLMYILLFYFFIKYIRGNANYFIGVAFFSGLVLQFETASSILLITFVPFFYVFSQLFFFWEKRKNVTKKEWNKYMHIEIKKQSKIVGFSIIAFFISIATFLFFDLRHRFLITRAFFSFLISNKKENGYLDFPERFFNHLHSLQDVYFSHMHIRNGLLEILSVSILCIAIFLIVKHKVTFERIKEWFFCGVFPLGIFSLFLIYPYSVYPEYVLGLTIAVIFFFAVSASFIWKTAVGKILIIFFIASNFFSAVSSVQQQYQNSFPKNQSSGSYQNQKAVVDWIFADSRQKPFGYFVYTPETFTYGMDYLFWWEGSSIYKYIPKSEKVSQTYLILYPALAGDTQAHSFWKKHVIRTTASIEKQKVFLGNIIVQKLSPGKNEGQVDPNYYQNLIFR